MAAAEAAVVVLLAVPATRTAGFVAAAALLAVLTAGIAVVLARGTTAPCRCFGASATPLSARHLVRNGVLVVVAVLGLAAPAGPPGIGPALVATLAGAVAGLLVTVADDVVELFAPTSLSSKES